MNYDLGYLPHCEGAWNNYTTYDPMAIVTNYGTAYISKVAVSAGAYEPGVTAGWGNYWQILAEGVQGTTGNRGPQGAAGTDANVIELTQAEYDALVVKDPDTIYIITDAVGPQGPAGTNGVDGAQGAQGPAGTSPSIPALYWKIKGYFHKAGASDLVVDKMGGGELHVYTGVKSLKLTNVQKGEGTAIGNADKVYDGWIPTYMFIGVEADFVLHQSDMKDSKGTTTFILCNQHEGKFLAGHNYLLKFFQNYIEVEEMYSLPS